MKQKLKNIGCMCIVIIIVLSVSFFYWNSIINNTLDITTDAPTSSNTALSYSKAEPFQSEPESDEKGLYVHVLDVGQGSCMFITCEGENMLVDGGDRDTSSKVVSYLKRQPNLNYLNNVIITHYHSDHLAGIIGVLHTFPVIKCYAPDYETDSSLYASYKATVDSYGYTVTTPTIDSSFNLGSAKVTFIAPVTKYEEENDNSIGLKITYRDISFLISGDSTKIAEKDTLSMFNSRLNSDVYIVNHHGSNFSSLPEYVQAISPSIAVISCGTDNTYGHPGEDTIETLKENNCTLFRTDLEGNILFYSDGEKISCQVEKEVNGELLYVPRKKFEKKRLRY